MTKKVTKWPKSITNVLVTDTTVNDLLIEIYDWFSDKNMWLI